jgi:hypothetical protein
MQSCNTISDDHTVHAFILRIRSWNMNYAARLDIDYLTHRLGNPQAQLEFMATLRKPHRIHPPHDRRATEVHRGPVTNGLILSGRKA